MAERPQEITIKTDGGEMPGMYVFAQAGPIPDLATIKMSKHPEKDAYGLLGNASTSCVMAINGLMAFLKELGIDFRTEVGHLGGPSGPKYISVLEVSGESNVDKLLQIADF